MFTGIVQAVGKVAAITFTDNDASSGDARLTIDVGDLPFEDVAIGDSICISGACMTVVEFDAHSFATDVSRESLSLTTLGDLDTRSRVNLELAMQPQSRFGGHVVTGHVDGIATIECTTDDVRSTRVSVKVPPSLSRYIARKGSVCLDGVSLTVNGVSDDVFDVNLIPHTQEVTTLDEWTPGRRVNLEIDLFARYIERLIQADDS